jgi:hypothetical protein
MVNHLPMTRSTPALLVLALGAALSGAGCEEKKTRTETAVPEAGADKYATADPKLSKVLSATTSSSAASDKGPPPAGIFPPGVADQRHPKGVPTGVELLTEGADPRVSLLPSASPDAARASSYGPAMLEVATQIGPRAALPTVDFVLTLGPGRKDEGGADWLQADVRRAQPSRQQLGQLPAGMEKDIGSLAGTTFRMKLTADGRAGEMETRLGKGTMADLDRVATGAAEALFFSTVPIPAKAVGVGAQWIAETRMALSGLDVVAYRAYRVKEIEGDRVRLTLDVKAYAAGKDVELQGVPKGATLEQFDAQSGGEIELVRGELLARKAEIQQRVVMVLQEAGAGQTPPSAEKPMGNALTAQVQSRASLVRGEDARVTSKQP